jgi:hypothetical protein
MYVMLLIMREFRENSLREYSDFLMGVNKLKLARVP